jgi:ribosome biogenesis protein Tsr3
MKVLIGARCVFDHNKVKENEALEICTPAVMAVDCSRNRVSGMIRGELVRVMDLLADCNPGNYGENRALMVKTEPAGTWEVLTGAALERGIVNLAKRLSETKDGELYIALPNSKQVEIYKIEEV